MITSNILLFKWPGQLRKVDRKDDFLNWMEFEHECANNNTALNLQGKKERGDPPLTFHKQELFFMETEFLIFKEKIELNFFYKKYLKIHARIIFAVFFNIF